MEGFDPANIRKYLQLPGGETGRKELLGTEALWADRPRSFKRRSRVNQTFLYDANVSLNWRTLSRCTQILYTQFKLYCLHIEEALMFSPSVLKENYLESILFYY